ncbi:10_t:CDS:10, partial [Acaulospora morrowiae]
TTMSNSDLENETFVSDKEPSQHILSEEPNNAHGKTSEAQTESSKTSPEHVNERMSEAETESSTNLGTNLRRSTRNRKPPKYYSQGEASIPARKSRRMDHDRKEAENISDDDVTSETDVAAEPTFEIRRKRGRPRKSSVIHKNSNKVTRRSKNKTSRRDLQNTPEGSQDNLTDNMQDDEVEDSSESQTLNKRSSKAGGSHKLMEESGQTIYDAIFGSSSSLETVAFNWEKAYKREKNNNHSSSLLTLINFIIRSCGCTDVIDKKTFEETDDITNVLKGLQDVFKKELLADYPLISKAREYKKFRKNFLGFFYRLILHLKYDVIYDDFFMDTLQAWVVPMSSSCSRPFRHTATMVALHLFSCICEVAHEVCNELSIASRQLELENKKPRSTKNMERINGLQLKATDLSQKKNKLYSHFDDLFDSVFVHRYRDVEPIIRSECIHELGIWTVKHPDRFLDNTIIRYVGWQLSDKSVIVRLESLKVLERLYAEETFVSGLRIFTERFKPRLLEMAIRESDINVRISSIHILTLIHQIGLLDDEERDQLSLLMYCDIYKVRKAVAPFIKISLDDFIKEKRTKVQTLMVGSGTKRKRNIDIGSNNEANATKQSWVSFKCLAEFFVKYNKALEDAQKEDEASDREEDEIDEVEFDYGALIHSTGDMDSSRIGFAVQDLWADIDVLKEWRKLADYLSKDHSSTSQGPRSPSSGNSSNSIEEFYRLSEKEESALVEVFVKCMQLTLSDSSAQKDKKKTEGQMDETRAEISRTMITILPRLLT